MRPNDLWRKLAESFFLLKRDLQVGLPTRLSLNVEQFPSEKEAVVLFKSVHSDHLYFLQGVQQLQNICRRHLVWVVEMV